MQTIKFSHVYKKMPEHVTYLQTYVTEVLATHYDDLSEEFIRLDTEYAGGYYDLPKTKLLIIELWSDTINGGHRWQTVRPWTKQKEEYYRSLRGQQVKIEIKKGAI
jgi:hypothetical protein